MTTALAPDVSSAPDEPLVAPFAGWMVHPNWAERVISRAYDNLSAEQRRSLVTTNPYSYMNVTRSRDDLDDNTDRSHDDLVADGAAALTRLLDSGAFTATGRPALYLYRLSHRQGVQTGVVCTVSVRGFADGRIRIHENVHDERADLLTAHLRGVGATSSPVAMAVRFSHELAAVLHEITTTVPADLEFGSTTVRHHIWTVPEELTPSLTAAFADKVLYVTDGHHRSAAAVQALAAEPDDAALARTLAVVFPDEHLHVQAFHRMAVDQHSRSHDDCLAALAEAAEVTAASGSFAARPREKGMAGLYLGGSWHKLELPPAVGKGAVSGPRCGTAAPLGARSRAGGRRTRATGRRGLSSRLTGASTTWPGSAMRRTGWDSRCTPLSVRELMAVADEGGLMPPKSSFFAPKPRSGVFLRVLGRGATAHLPAS